MDMSPFPWLKDKPDTFQYHLENDTGDFETYTRKKRLDLGESLLKIRRIYLDTKYWLYVRDVYLNRSKNPLHGEIVNELRRLRDSGSTICPVSYSIFSELLYQSDPVTRNATAEMIDELSDGCTIQPPHEVFRRELIHFVTKMNSEGVELYEIDQMVWTKAVFILGDRFLSLEGSPFSPKHALAIRKTMDDLFWSISLSEILGQWPLSDRNKQESNIELAEALTDGKFEHRKQSGSFEKLFLDEVQGVLDGHRSILGSFAVHLGQKNGLEGNLSKNEISQLGNILGRQLWGGYKYKRISTELPSISIPSSLTCLKNLYQVL
ncbi:MAG: hypothetical protein ACIAZJ_07775 [Gimesia chilikensis]|uniref:hypothetical protein n=1 Tax=Gimesia chilikensis TaxID=2605989 RepID=UPI0037A8346C